MAKKKYYAVKKGYEVGIFESWDSCKKQVDGFKCAEYKSFSTRHEAENWLKDKPFSDASDIENHISNSSELVAYVDGSYEHSIKKYAFGCVLITPDGRIFKKNGNGNNPASLAIRNVAGEMLGAMFAVKWARVNGFSKIEIRYDYEGIEKWVTGVWQAKNELTSKYALFMRNQMKAINIKFTKVLAHSNNKYNDMADELAKKALNEADGIPEVMKEV